MSAGGEPDLATEECPDVTEADAIGNALAEIFGGVVVCQYCTALIHRDEDCCPDCGRAKPLLA